MIEKGDVVRVAFGRVEVLADVEDPNYQGKILIDRITDGMFGGHRITGVEPDRILAVYRRVEREEPPPAPSATPGIGRPETAGGKG